MNKLSKKFNMTQYIAFITFKHLPHWQKRQLVEAKSAKKAECIIRRMYKDAILKVIIEEQKGK